MQFETMGLLVVRKTYSIAVACLSPDVLQEAPEDLFGQFLVINEPVTRWVGDSEDRPPILAHDMQNRLYGPDMFELKYKLVGKHEPNQFFRVKKIRDHERKALLDAMSEEKAAARQPQSRYLYPRGRLVRVRYRNGFSR